jgi:hypothetical protein
MGVVVNRGERKLLVTGILVAVAIVTALLIDVVIGSSGGASTPSSTKTNLAKPGVGGPNATTSVGATNYSTVGTFVNLRSSASTNASIVANMSAFGTPLTLYCYLHGAAVGSDPWWYQASHAGVRGYVSGVWVNTGPDPAKTHLPAC